MSNILTLEKGKTLSETLAPVSRMDLIKYSGASGDFNPIHTVDEEAKKTGLPGIIAHGMWTMGNLAKLFTPYYEEGFIKDYRIRFSGMVFIDDVITLVATVTAEEEQEIAFEVKAVNQAGKAVLKGDVTFVKTNG
ncbi:MaoC/PaaZ C-terminal domain-containing protein [Cytobacillus sp. FSL W7-1323]|uniref:MaoC/PaaZ C-terminal domain-containing protein n=1 Tax=Cytobacillus TaxID=2675230 RepID=UPI00278025AE|nr:MULTISPECIES: MaoC/PaaZ C-terminal domain-containing protein [Cytobacillus]MDQ0184662.1 acyl dehydratase [Cytobacillus kochii]MEA1852121.1 MaoC/PaaZ C-terminal domain-containing protein [Cytobacillus sp. OWB-43]MED1606650.1 MaoC/PaaZ C-terminal domain-containing protein [Cytobacillus kochii]